MLNKPSHSTIIEPVTRKLRSPQDDAFLPSQDHNYPYEGYALGPSLAAALLNGLFEHPLSLAPVIIYAIGCHVHCISLLNSSKLVSTSGER